MLLRTTLMDRIDFMRLTLPYRGSNVRSGPGHKAEYRFPSPAVPGPRENPMSKGAILVVDNDPQIRRMMRATLVSQGFEIADARSGDEGLERLRTERFDLVVLDVNMPGMS